MSQVQNSAHQIHLILTFRNSKSIDTNRLIYSDFTQRQQSLSKFGKLIQIPTANIPLYSGWYSSTANDEFIQKTKMSGKIYFPMFEYRRNTAAATTKGYGKACTKRYKQRIVAFLLPSAGTGQKRYSPGLNRNVWDKSPTIASALRQLQCTIAVEKNVENAERMRFRYSYLPCFLIKFCKHIVSWAPYWVQCSKNAFACGQERTIV